MDFKVRIKVRNIGDEKEILPRSIWSEVIHEMECGPRELVAGPQELPGGGVGRKIGQHDRVGIEPDGVLVVVHVHNGGCRCQGAVIGLNVTVKEGAALHVLHRALRLGYNCSRRVVEKRTGVGGLRGGEAMATNGEEVGSSCDVCWEVGLDGNHCGVRGGHQAPGNVEKSSGGI